MMKMNNKLLTACMALSLMASIAAPSLAAPRLRLAEQNTGTPESCATYCKTNADFCREQCANPEEPEQCIVACSKSECNDSCNKFEEACKKHCPAPNNG
jgi:hypothetical protein